MLFLCEGRLLHLFVQSDTSLLKPIQGLLQLANLISGRHHARSFHHVHEHVVECVGVARNWKHLAQCLWRRVSRREKWRQCFLEIALDCGDV